MSDKITVDELKVFVGTGLKVEFFEDNSIFELHGVTGWDDIILAEIGKLRVKSIFITPIVRPWSHLTKEIEHNGERFVPMLRIVGGEGQEVKKHISFEVKGKIKLLKKTIANFNDPDATGDAMDVLEQIYHRADGNNFSIVQKLASWHFDIFNWLSRTGEDGQPLAIEMKL